MGLVSQRNNRSGSSNLTLASRPKGKRHTKKKRWDTPNIFKKICRIWRSR